MTLAADGTALHEIVGNWALETPDARAVDATDESVTYATLDRRARTLAAGIVAADPGDAPVAVCAGRSSWLVVGMLGALWSGRPYLPVDPNLPPARIDFMLEHSGAQVVLVDDAARAKLAGSGRRLVPLAENHAVEPLDPGSSPASPESLAYVIYTSGSTGRPKGVAVSHGNVLSLFGATSKRFDLSDEDVWLMFHSSSFDFSVWETFGALLHGGRLVVPSYATTRSPAATWETIRGEGVTVLNQTPTAFYELAGAEPSGAAQSLRLVVFGGEKLDFRRLEGWVKAHGTARPRLVNMYGITEVTVHVTAYELSDGDAASRASVIGEPLDHVSIALLDESGDAVADGTAGEMYVAGGGVAQGYYNDPDLTRERFVRVPGLEGIAYRTGDVARREAGGLVFLGRRDRQVQVRGHRVELDEIELSLSANELAADVAVVMVEDGTLLAFFSPASDPSAAVTALRELARSVLPPYMVPSAFHPVDKLPMTINGKVDYDALVRRGTEAKPASPAPGEDDSLESVISKLFSERLGGPIFGPDDDFFDLGGHSVMALRIMARLRELVDDKLPVTLIFDYPTPRSLAAEITRGRDA